MADGANGAVASAAPDPWAQAVAAHTEYCATKEKLAAQATRWEAHCAAAPGSDERLDDDNALALLVEHSQTRELLATQAAQLYGHVEPLLEADATGADAAMAPWKQAITARGEYHATKVNLAAQAARWEAHCAAAPGSDERLGDDNALALLVEHSQTRELLATQAAQLEKYIEPLFHPAARTNPMTDPATLDYYRNPPKPPANKKRVKAARKSWAGKGKAKATSPSIVRKQQETKAWGELRAKVTQLNQAPASKGNTAVAAQPTSPTNLTRSEVMENNQKPAAAPTPAPADGIPVLNDVIPAEQARAIAAKQGESAAPTNPDTARQASAGQFAPAQALMGQAPWAGALDGLTGARSALTQLTVPAPPENTIEPALAEEAIDQQAKTLREVVGTASILMSGQKDTLDRDEAAAKAAADIEALDQITDPDLRTTALLAVAESRHAQRPYQDEFDSRAPALAAEVDAQVAERFGAEYAAERAAEIAARQAATTTASEPPLRNFDDETLKNLTARRARDMQEVARLRGWQENSIERADVATHAPPAEPAGTPLAQAPAAPASTPPATPPAVNVTAVPAEVEQAFLHVGNKFYMPKNKERVAFEDHGSKLKTVLNQDNVALAMVQVAHARGWGSIKVSGTPDFCEDAWREASLLGLSVQGYKPTNLDLADLQRRMPAKPANEVAVAPAPAAMPPGAPVLVDGQPGIFISAEDAALLAAAKAARKTPPVSLDKAVVQPAAAKTGPSETLVAHGQAKYKNDPDGSDSYYVTLANDAGKERTVWGVNLGKTIEKSGVQVGQRISLTLNGKEHVEVEAKVKDVSGKVVGTEKIGALRNEWQVKAHTLATQPPEQVAKAHPELSGMLGKLFAVAKRAVADGLQPEQVAYVVDRARQNAAADVARGNAPKQEIREKVETKRKPQQEMAQ